MKPRFIVRAATEQDADAILECLRLAFEPYRQHYTVEAFQDTTLTRQTVHRRLAEYQVLMATTPAGEIVGSIACNVSCPGEGHLRGMAVMPERLGQGVATILLEAAETWLRKQQCKRITLDTTAPLQRAIRFYEKNGYKQSGTVGDFYGMPLYEYVKEPL